MFSLIELVIEKCRQAVNTAYPELSTEIIEVTSTSHAKFGHYQLNSAMRFAKILGKPPRIIAENIITKLNKEDLFSNISIAGAGFVNFTLADHFLEQNIKLLVKSGKFSWEQSTVLSDNKVIIDFSSPNIAKDMHVGHLRSTIIGDCLARILEFLNYEVLRINHIGDWGTQFGMLIAYLKINNKLSQTLTPSFLVDYYKQAKSLFDTDLNFKKTAQQEVVLLQSGDQDSLTIWKNICEISAQAYREIYQLLDIKIIDRGESFYNGMLRQVVDDFEEKHLLQESDGAKCIYLPGFINREQEPLPIIIQKSDGGYNYATTDLAAIKHRVQQEHANWLIYVTDSGQSLHFSMIFAAAKQVGYLQNDMPRVDHVPFGLVLRSDGKKFKTREGDTEKLKDLIIRAILKAKDLLLIRNPDLLETELENMAHIMGVNAIKYADLSNNRNSDYMFDYEKMLQFTGNTAAFLSYAYVRINSIKNKIAINIEDLINSNVKIQLIENYERDLAIRICRFQDAVKASLSELMPNRLTDYLYLLAEEFHAFFHHCRVEGSASQDSRILLCEAVAKVLAMGFNLLGLKLINKM
ncbi:MAG: arginine--tRNA ligase [Gammaproteobacteria bacterium]|jgi:arginyl-tRNA synthetase